MRKLIISALVGLFYCFPFVYFAMYQDFTNGSLTGYLIMIIGTSAIAFLGRLYSNTTPIIIGNIASVMISFYFLSRMEYIFGSSWDGGYFKPFSPYQLLLFVSFLNVIPQFLVMMLANRVRKKARFT